VTTHQNFVAPSAGLARRSFVVRTIALAAALPASALRAQTSDFPNKPIRLVVAYAAGGGTDAAARVFAEAMTRELGQTMYVENRVGASGNIGGNFVAKARPDGYTLLFGAMANLAINPYLFKDMPYAPEKDFASIGKVFDTPHVIVAGPSSEIKSFDSLLKLARQSPKKYTYASAGAGTSTHIVAELFAHTVGVNLTHIPYKGNGPALIDVMGGQVDLMFDQVPNSAPSILGGKVNGLALMAAARLPSLASVPSVAELGYPQLATSSWTGLLAPAGLPADVVAALNRATNKVLADPDVKQRFDKLGALPTPSAPGDLSRLLASDSQRFGALIKSASIKAD
jgi:tripartite-type tricarboxylate transporter receptor subunit TctC